MTTIEQNAGHAASDAIEVLMDAHQKRRLAARLLDEAAALEGGVQQLLVHAHECGQTVAVLTSKAAVAGARPGVDAGDAADLEPSEAGEAGADLAIAAGLNFEPDRGETLWVHPMTGEGLAGIDALDGRESVIQRQLQGSEAEVSDLIGLSLLNASRADAKDRAVRDALNAAISNLGDDTMTVVVDGYGSLDEPSFISVLVDRVMLQRLDHARRLIDTPPYLSQVRFHEAPLNWGGIEGSIDNEELCVTRGGGWWFSGYCGEHWIESRVVELLPFLKMVATRPYTDGSLHVPVSQRVYVAVADNASADAARKAFLTETAEEQACDAARRHYERYDFGAGVSVESQQGWELEFANDEWAGPSRASMVVYLRFDDDAPDAATHKATVHVDFGPGGEVTSAVALLVENGGEIGAPGLPVVGIDSAADAERPRQGA